MIRSVANGSRLSRFLRASNPFCRVRWSDGTIAAFSLDWVALTLYGLSCVATVVLLVMVVRNSGSESNVNWYGFVAAIYLADVLARWRLRSAVSAAERRGAASRQPWSAEFRSRMFEAMAQRCDRRARKLLVQAAEAEARGDCISADAHRRKAMIERERAEKCRPAPEAEGPRGGAT